LSYGRIWWFGTTLCDCVAFARETLCTTLANFAMIEHSPGGPRGWRETPPGTCRGGLKSTQSRNAREAGYRAKALTSGGPDCLGAELKSTTLC
jgi:hypothetical protein